MKTIGDCSPVLPFAPPPPHFLKGRKGENRRGAHNVRKCEQVAVWGK